MPDSADNGRPSSAPLSVEDAERLADSFHAFWDEEPETASPGPVAPAPIAAPAPHPVTVTAPMPAVAPTPAAAKPAHPAPVTAPMPAAVPTPHPVAVTAPMPAVEPVVAKPKPLGKQTLIGIAPITIENPRTSESEKPPAALSEKPPAALSEKPPPSQPVQSSPEVPGYAIAYTPKDPPSTPAVVIAPEAQSSPDHAPPENRRQFSQTMPSRVRSSPNASLSPPPSPAAIADDFNPYEKKGKGKVVGLVASGALLLLVSVLGVRALSGGQAESKAPAPTTDVVRAATVGASIPTPEPAEVVPTAVAASPAPPTRTPKAESEPAATTARPVSERAPAKTKTKAKSESVAAAARPVTRAPTSEPSSPVTKPASKGVIVRDAPF